MGKQPLSRKKHMKKADSPNRSTTSSTTAGPSGSDDPQMVTSESLNTEVQVPTGNRHDPPRLLSEDQQDLFLEVLSHGASPAMACRKLHLLLSDANHTRRLDAGFAQRWQQIEQALSQNVASALYSSAMKGTASAQTFYLKQQPPPGWDRDANREPLRGDNFEECTDAELVELARTMGIDPPPEIAGGNESAVDEKVPGHVPEADPDRE